VDSHHLDGLLRAGARGLVASRRRPWGSPGFSILTDRPHWRSTLRSVPPAPEPLHVTVQHALLPFAACAVRLQGLEPGAGPLHLRGVATVVCPMLPWASFIQVGPRNRSCAPRHEAAVPLPKQRFDVHGRSHVTVVDRNRRPHTALPPQRAKHGTCRAAEATDTLPHRESASRPPRKVATGALRRPRRHPTSYLQGQLPPVPAEAVTRPTALRQRRGASEPAPGGTIRRVCCHTRGSARTRRSWFTLVATHLPHQRPRGASNVGPQRAAAGHRHAGSGRSAGLEQPKLSNIARVIFTARVKSHRCPSTPTGTRGS
jgi:hypothetical protein